jgi:hypothetical protein
MNREWEMSLDGSHENQFLSAPIGRLFGLNALPMAFVMSMGGLLNLADAAFLGRFAGASALTAISLSFPIVMVTIALSTLVSGGMSSLYARQLGAGGRDAAGASFARAHGLSLIVAFTLLVAFLTMGRAVLRAVFGGETEIAGMAETYLVILITGAPVQFLLGLHADALRNEGRGASGGAHDACEAVPLISNSDCCPDGNLGATELWYACPFGDGTLLVLAAGIVLRHWTRGAGKAGFGISFT